MAHGVISNCPNIYVTRAIQREETKKEQKKFLWTNNSKYLPNLI